MSGSVYDTIANPKTAQIQPVNLLDTLRGAYVGMSVRELQAKQAAGQAMQNAIDPDTGQLDVPQFRRNLLAAGPGAAMAAEASLTTGQNLGTEAQNQAIQQRSQIINAYTGLLRRDANGNPVIPDAQLHDATAAAMDDLVSKGIIPRSVGMAALAKAPNDPGALRTQMQTQAISLMSPQEQQATNFGTRPAVAAGGSVQFPVVPPASAGGAGPTVPITLTPGEKVQTQPTIGAGGQPGSVPIGSRFTPTGDLKPPGWGFGGGKYPTQPPPAAGGASAPAAQPPAAAPPAAATGPQGAPVADVLAGLRAGAGAPGQQFGPGVPGSRYNPQTQQWEAAPAQSAPAPIAPQAPTAPAPTGAASPAVAANPPGFLPTGQPLGTEAALQAHQRIYDAADAATTQKSQLLTMEGDLNRISTGPAADKLSYYNALAKQFGFPSTMSADELAGAEGFRKVAKQIALAQAGSLGVGTDEKLTTAMGANPSLDLSKMGNKQIIAMLQGNADALRARGVAYDRWLQEGHSPADANRFLSQFNRTFDPRVYQWNYQIRDMTDAQRQAAFNAMPDKMQFQANYNNAVRQGLIPSPTQSASNG